MTDIIANFSQDAATNKKQTIKHELTVQIEPKTIIEDAIKAWGGAVKNSRSAPSWSRVEPFIEEIAKEKAKLSVITDENAAGAMRFEFSEKQNESFKELKEMLSANADRIGVDDATKAAASQAFDASIQSHLFAEQYGAESGNLTVAALLEKTAAINPVFTHPQYNELDAKSMVSLSKIKAPPAMDGDPNSDDAIAAQMPRHVPASDMTRYNSMGQMVKASDAQALAEYIALAKEKQIWDKDKEEACSKLAWVAGSLGSVETMRVLLDKGNADIDFTDARGYTPLLAAVANNHPDMIDFLIKRGANKRITPADGRSLIMLAASHDAVDSIKTLHKLGFDINELSLEGRTALHHAALGEDDKTAKNAIKTLMELGADPRIVDLIGDEGGHVAEEYIDSESDDVYAQLCQFRKDWEEGKTGPQSAVSSTISKARAMLGF